MPFLVSSECNPQETDFRLTIWFIFIFRFFLFGKMGGVFWLFSVILGPVDAQIPPYGARTLILCFGQDIPP